MGLFTQPVAAQIYKKFKDWDVECAVDLKCTLRHYGGNSKLYYFGLDRTAQAQSALSLILNVNGALDEKSELKLKVESKAELFMLRLPLSDGKLENGEWRFDSSEEFMALSQEMMRGNRLTLEMPFTSGKEVISISLSGVTASAIFIDENQQRVGNEDALRAKGDGPAKDAVTRVREVLAAYSVPDPVLQIWNTSFTDCSETYGEDEEDLFEQYGGLAITLTDKATLFILPCGSGGAYNFSKAVFIYDEGLGKARQLPLPTVGEHGLSVMHTAFNTYWDDKASTFSAFYKGRGLGDCGLLSTWKWSGDFFGSFELIEERSKEHCDGDFRSEWPKTWPVQ